MLMSVQNKPEYKALVQAIMVANKCGEGLAENYLDDAMTDIEQGEASYASAAMNLGLHVNQAGQCGFDAADYLASIV